MCDGTGSKSTAFSQYLKAQIYMPTSGVVRRAIARPFATRRLLDLSQRRAALAHTTQERVGRGRHNVIVRQPR